MDNSIKLSSGLLYKSNVYTDLCCSYPMVCMCVSWGKNTSFSENCAYETWNGLGNLIIYNS